MELWVRSQNKKILEKVDTIMYSNINAEREYDEHVYNYKAGHFIQSSMNTLGEYETEERALEILNEIQELLLERKCYATDYIATNLIYELPLE